MLVLKVILASGTAAPWAKRHPTSLQIREHSEDLG